MIDEDRPKEWVVNRRWWFTMRLCSVSDHKCSDVLTRGGGRRFECHWNTGLITMFNTDEVSNGPGNQVRNETKQAHVISFHCFTSVHVVYSLADELTTYARTLLGKSLSTLITHLLFEASFFSLLPELVQGSFSPSKAILFRIHSTRVHGTVAGPTFPIVATTSCIRVGRKGDTTLSVLITQIVASRCTPIDTSIVPVAAPTLPSVAIRHGSCHIR